MDITNLNSSNHYYSSEINKNRINSKNYSDVKQYTDYLYNNYSAYRNGTVTISQSYIRKCLESEEERSKLEENLLNAESMLENAKENCKGFDDMEIRINDEGEMETVTYGGSVTFNEGKRNAQVASAKTSADIKVLMSILAKDLSDCESGLKNGYCDDNEVKKVKAMIANAQKKQMEILIKEKREKEKGNDDSGKLTINLMI